MGTGSVKEDNLLIATGQFNAVSSDPLASLSGSIHGSQAGTYGSPQLQANGTWAYTLNNAASVVQGLSSVDTRTDDFTVQLLDSTGTLGAGSPEKNAVLTWSADNGGHGTNGSLSIDKAGGWTYQLDDASAAPAPMPAPS